MDFITVFVGIVGIAIGSFGGLVAATFVLNRVLYGTWKVDL